MAGEAGGRSEVDELSVWLSGLGLNEYNSTFVNSGFDDMSIIKEINEKDLIDMGISKPGHRKKLLIGVEKIKNGPNQGPTPSPSISSINTNIPPTRHSSYTFNTDTKTQVLVVTNGGKTVGRNHSEGKSPIIVSNEPWTGNLIQIRIDEPAPWENNRTSIGICTLSAFTSIKSFTGFQNVVGRVPCSFGYVFDGQQSDSKHAYLFCEGQQIPADNYYKGDLIGFSFNFVTNEISFFKNNVMEGSPRKIPGKPTDYHLGVSLATSCKVTIL